MTRAAVEKLAWGFGGLVLVLALAFPLAERPADPGLWMASLGYLIGFHWIVAFFLNGKTLHTSTLAQGWAVTLDTLRVANGPHTMEARLMKNGRTYARKSVRFIVDN